MERIVFKGVAGVLASIFVVVSAVACTEAASREEPASESADSASGVDGGVDAPPKPGPDDASSPGDAGTNPDPVPVIYANAMRSWNILYKFDPITNALTKVAMFGGHPGCNYGGIEEIAIDRDLNGYAAGQAGRFHFDPATAICDGPAPREGSSATGLSFAPAKPGQPKDTLWGFIAYGTDTVDLYWLDASGEEKYLPLPASRFRTNLNKFQGDMVTTTQGRTFATAGSGLFEIDLQTGAVLTDFGDLGYADVNGLASWGATLYGFTGDGKIFKVVPTQGGLKPTLLATTDVPFSGAASAVPR